MSTHFCNVAKSAPSERKCIGYPYTRGLEKSLKKVSKKASRRAWISDCYIQLHFAKSAKTYKAKPDAILEAQHCERAPLRSHRVIYNYTFSKKRQKKSEQRLLLQDNTIRMRAAKQRGPLQKPISPCYIQFKFFRTFFLFWYPARARDAVSACAPVCTSRLGGIVRG